MTEKEWKELNDLGDGEVNPDRFEELIEKTTDEEEHPEGYDGACMCILCQSYGN